MSQSVAQSLSNNSANFLTTSSVRPFSNNLNSNMMNNNQQGPLGILGGTSLLPSTSSGNNSNTFVTAGNSNTRPYFSVSNNTNNNNGKAALNSLGVSCFIVLYLKMFDSFKYKIERVFQSTQTIQKHTFNTYIQFYFKYNASKSNKFKYCDSKEVNTCCFL